MANDSTAFGFLTPEASPTLAPDDDFDAVLQTLVVGITGLSGTLVRPRWQSSPPPEPEVEVNWCAVGVTDEDPDSMPFVTHVGSEDAGQGADFVQVNDTANCLASFYGPSARGYAGLFRSGLMVAQNREALQRKNMGLVGMPGAARFVPAIVSMQTQRRVDVPFSIRRADTVKVAVRNIAAVKIEVYPNDEPPITRTQGATPPP